MGGREWGRHRGGCCLWALGRAGLATVGSCAGRMDLGHPLYTRHGLCVGLDKVWGAQPVRVMAEVGTGPVAHEAGLYWGPVLCVG